jgi:hypothetical protein
VLPQRRPRRQQARRRRPLQPQQVRGPGEGGGARAATLRAAVDAERAVAGRADDGGRGAGPDRRIRASLARAGGRDGGALGAAAALQRRRVANAAAGRPAVGGDVVRVADVRDPGGRLGLGGGDGLVGDRGGGGGRGRRLLCG